MKQYFVEWACFIYNTGHYGSDETQKSPKIIVSGFVLAQRERERERECEGKTMSDEEQLQKAVNDLPNLKKKKQSREIEPKDAELKKNKKGKGKDGGEEGVVVEKKKKKKRKKKEEEEEEEDEEGADCRFPMRRVDRIIRSGGSDYRLTHEAVFLINKATVSTPSPPFLFL